MVKEILHIFRTYFITFRYLKKSELKTIWIFVFCFILYFLFNFIIL